MKITTIGIDLAKNVFQVHGVDEHGKAVFNKPLKREQMAAFFVNLPPCLIGMEACGSAHHWGRTAERLLTKAMFRRSGWPICAFCSPKTRFSYRWNSRQS